MSDNINDEGLKFAYQHTDKHNWTKAELDAYDYVLMCEQDDWGRWTLALRREKEAIARKLLDLGLSLGDIAKTTGLTIDQVQKLNQR